MTKDELVLSLVSLGLTPDMVEERVEFEIQHDSPEVARLCLTHWIWQECILESTEDVTRDRSYVGPESAVYEQKEKAAIQSLLSSGVDPTIIYDLIRSSQIIVILEVMAWLQGGTVHDYPKEVALFELNEDGSPGRLVEVAESFLELDPEWDP